MSDVEAFRMFPLFTQKCECVWADYSTKLFDGHPAKLLWAKNICCPCVVWGLPISPIFFKFQVIQQSAATCNWSHAPPGQLSWVIWITELYGHCGGISVTPLVNGMDLHLHATDWSHRCDLWIVAWTEEFYSLTLEGEQLLDAFKKSNVLKKNVQSKYFKGL